MLRGSLPVKRRGKQTVNGGTATFAVQTGIAFLVMIHLDGEQVESRQRSVQIVTPKGTV